MVTISKQSVVSRVVIICSSYWKQCSYHQYSLSVATITSVLLPVAVIVNTVVIISSGVNIISIMSLSSFLGHCHQYCVIVIHIVSPSLHIHYHLESVISILSLSSCVYVINVASLTSFCHCHPHWVTVTTYVPLSSILCYYQLQSHNNAISFSWDQYHHATHW